MLTEVYFTFHADILKLVYHLYRSTAHSNQRRIYSAEYNENGKLEKRIS